MSNHLSLVYRRSIPDSNLRLQNQNQKKLYQRNHGHRPHGDNRMLLEAGIDINPIRKTRIS